MAEAILRLADRPRAELSVGLTNGIIRFGFTALPPVYDALVGPMMRRIGLSRSPSTPAPATSSRPATGRRRPGAGGVGARVVGAAAAVAGIGHGLGAAGPPPAPRRELTGRHAQVVGTSA